MYVIGVIIFAWPLKKTEKGRGGAASNQCGARRESANEWHGGTPLHCYPAAEPRKQGGIKKNMKKYILIRVYIYVCVYMYIYVYVCVCLCVCIMYVYIHEYMEANS